MDASALISKPALPRLGPLSLALLFVSLCSPLYAQSATNDSPPSVVPATSQAKTFETTLDNGLKVIIREDHRTPVVMTQVWYKVGSSDETSDETGLSHALEHMMFKGTTLVPNDEYSRINTRFGGNNNAFTTANYTGYYQLYPANRLSLALEMEADRMQNLKLREEDFKPEMQVIMEERRMRTDDNPKALAFERFLAMAYPTSPLRLPVIGHMKNLQNLKLDALKRWYETWYAPNNAVLVIVGDTKPEAALPEIKRYFAQIPKRPVPQRPDVDEFLHSGERSMTLHMAVQVPTLFLAWNVPSLSTAPKPQDVYALNLASEILDGGLSARLEKHLVREKRLLAAVSASYEPFERGGALFSISAVPTPGHTLEDIKSALLDEIEHLKHDPITSDELNRVKVNQRAQLIYNQDSISEQAQMIGALEVSGLSYKVMDDLENQYNALSTQTVQDTVKQYLTPDSLSTLYLQPLEQPAAATTQTTSKPTLKKANAKNAKAADTKNANPKMMTTSTRTATPSNAKEAQ